jgi:hypothetical protein
MVRCLSHSSGRIPPLWRVPSSLASPADASGPSGGDPRGGLALSRSGALKPESQAILKAAMEGLGLSARAHDKVLQVARTTADLEGQEDIKPQHIAEAVGYRSLDRRVWAKDGG